MNQGVYARWVGWWEQRLASRDNNRTVRSFEWGLDWLGCADPVEDPSRYVRDYARNAASGSADFFSYHRPPDFTFDGTHLGFTSPLASPYPENNRVHAALFPASRDRGRAVVVLPQWNAGPSGHAALCRLLNRFGVTALRMSLAYHDKRTPAGLQRADYHVSSNVGRTIHASRQSVIDARACLDWLEGQGYQRLGILGTSLGSCIAFIVAAHDPRVRVGVFNHVSMQFGDVVWTGLATRHVRQGLSEVVSQDDLREYWAPISPATYLNRLAGRDLNSLLVWARYDTTFLPAYSREFMEAFRASGYRHDVAALPCAHYTTGEFPFNILDAFHMSRFLSRYL